ncbi:MAG: GGDEF domain-containing protein, partial [Candidatus Adiutrix sp.]
LEEIEILRAVSFKDPLTNVYNRRAYDSQIFKTLTDVNSGALKTCGMLVFDIDLFREFNNTYGHLAGDRILMYVAKLTKETLRADDFIFRYGGDEFVVLLPNANLEFAIMVGEKIRRAINSVEFKIFKNSDMTVPITLSIGAAEVCLGDDPFSFFSRADQAMYAAKAAGRNKVFPLLGAENPA